MISAKIERLLNSGIDISGFHELEFQFYVVGKAKLPDLKGEFYHPDNSMRVVIKKHTNGFGYVFKVRMYSTLSQKSISSNLLWLSKVADKYNVILDSWCVVQRT